MRPFSRLLPLLLTPLWAVSAGCAKDADSAQTTLPAGTTVVTGPSFVEWTTDATSVGPGTSQHHATAALRSDGIAVVVWRAVDRSEAAVIGPNGSVTPLSLGDAAPVNHPQIGPTAEGYLIAATVDGALGLVGNSVDPGGQGIGEGVLITSGTAFVPDFDVEASGGMLVWHDQQTLFCSSFTGAFEELQARGCPDRVDSEAVLTIATTRIGLDRVVYAWDEWNPDGTLGVYFAVDAGNGPVPHAVDGLPWGGDMPGRPALAVDDVSAMQLVSWRGAEQVDGVIQSWVQAFGADGAPDQRWDLGIEPGGRPVEWPNVGGAVDGLAVVAWVEDAQLWVQVRDASTGGPVGEPIAAAIETTRDPRRPYVELAKMADGQVRGLVTWEAAPVGATTHTDDRLVRFRSFRIAL